MTYVKPEFGMITTPIVKLTRITPKEVAKAPKMGESLKKFSEWKTKKI
jgi:DNA polymerase III epsilon subunit-like protein